MKIQDLENRTGLERPTIRFYEREGLLNPKRLENGYREYSEEDASQLMKIKLLRQLGMRVERIKALQQGSADFSREMENQIRLLTDRIQQQNKAREVCRTMQADGVTYESMDAEHYLNLLRDSSLGGPEIKKNFREDLPEEIHPWRRFIARTIDYALFGTVLDTILFVILRIRPLPGDFMQALIAVVTTALFIPVEALMLHHFGTTPGKFTMGIRVEWIGGGNLPLWAAMDRSKQVCIRGEGCSIPLITIWCNFACYCRLTGRAIRRFQRYNDIDPPAEMPWDEQSELIYTDWEGKRIAVLSAVLVLWLLMTSLNIMDMVKPKYRGDLTIAEFAENYNFYYAFWDQDVVTRSERLQSDGKWYTESDQHITIYIDGQPEVPEQTFFYNTNNGNITGIHYENRWTDIFMLNPVPDRCLIAAITVLMSQNGSGFAELQEFGEQLDDLDFTKDGSYTYEGIELNWNVESENCIAVESKRLIREDENLPSSVSTVFEIKINP